MFIVDALNFIDMFQLPSYFMLNGQTKLSTNLSKSFTVFALVLLILLMITEFQKIFDRENFIYIDLKLDQPLGDKLSISQQDLMIGVKFNNESLQNNLNKYFSLNIVKDSFSYITGQQISVPYKLETCSEEHFANANEQYSQYNMQNSLCLPIGYQQDIYRDLKANTVISLKLEYCDVNQNSQCIDLSIAQNRIDFKQIYGQNQVIQLFFSQIEINPFDISQPIKRYIQSAPISINVDQLTYSDSLYKLEKNELNIQYSYFSYFENLSKKIMFNTLDFIDFSQLVQHRDPNQNKSLLINMHFLYSQKIRKISVKYDGILEAMVKIQTQFSLIFVAFSFVCQFYNEKIYQLKLAEKIFQINLIPKNFFIFDNLQQILTHQQYVYVQKHMDIGNLIDTNIFSEQLLNFFFSKKYHHLLEIFRVPQNDINELKNLILNNKQYKQQIDQIRFSKRNVGQQLDIPLKIDEIKLKSSIQQKDDLYSNEKNNSLQSDSMLIHSNENFRQQIQIFSFSNSSFMEVQDNNQQNEKILQQQKSNKEQEQNQIFVYKKQMDEINAGINQKDYLQNNYNEEKQISLQKIPQQEVEQQNEFDQFLAGFDLKDKDNPHTWFFDQILLNELKKLLTRKYQYKLIQS